MFSGRSPVVHLLFANFLSSQKVVCRWLFSQPLFSHDITFKNTWFENSLNSRSQFSLSNSLSAESFQIFAVWIFQCWTNLIKLRYNQDVFYVFAVYRFIKVFQVKILIDRRVPRIGFKCEKLHLKANRWATNISFNLFLLFIVKTAIRAMSATTNGKKETRVWCDGW